MPTRLGYWGVRGICQPIRLLLQYSGEDYVEERRTPTKPFSQGKEEWVKVKGTLGLDFPNLPYYIDDEVQITQSGTILRYLARKHNLEGDTVQVRVLADMINEDANDLRKRLIRTCLCKEFDYEKKSLLAALPAKLEPIARAIGSNKFIGGSKVTYADFNLYDVLYTVEKFAPGSLDAFPVLKQHQQSIESLPAIQKYRASEDYIKDPYFHCFAKWGYYNEVGDGFDIKDVHI